MAVAVGEDCAAGGAQEAALSVGSRLEPWLASPRLSD